MVQLEMFDDALKLMRLMVVLLDDLLLRMVDVYMVWMEHFVSFVMVEYDPVKMTHPIGDMLMVLQHVMMNMKTVVDHVMDALLNVVEGMRIVVDAMTNVVDHVMDALMNVVEVMRMYVVPR